MHVFPKEHYQAGSRGEVITDCLPLTKHINLWFRRAREETAEKAERAVNLCFFPPLHVLTARTYNIWVTSCLQRDFLIRPLGVFQPRPSLPRGLVVFLSL